MSTFISKIRDLSHKGYGVVDHPDGRVFFVRGVWPGDEVKVEVPDYAGKYTEARLLEILHPSAERVPVACPHRGLQAGECGGCPWMIAKYESQLKYKLKRLLHALEKRKVFLPDKILKEIKPSARTEGYRNRVQLKSDGQKLGYISEGTKILAPIESCLIMNQKVAEVFHHLKKALPELDLRPGENHPWFYIDLDDEMTLNDITPNRRRPFKQGNTEQNLFMREWVRQQFVEIERHRPVIDLFCGTGNFTQVLSDMGFSNILAVEVQGKALEILKQRNLPGVRILELDVNEKGSWAKIAKHQPHAKAILIDPPREGLEKRRGFFKYLDNLESVFYISCELDTYARDCEDFVSRGWRVDELTPIDLFPHTPHIEILSVLKPSKV
jgi:23S rRNA (uracil1939-C5)-methyltransferase